MKGASGDRFRGAKTASGTLLLLAFSCLAACTHVEPMIEASLILQNAKVWTGDSRKPEGQADAAHLQVTVHAIGDRANSLVLDAFEDAARDNPPWDRRFRIEHAQHLRAADIPRFARAGVIASMQPYHAIDDGRWAEKRIGNQRIRTNYAFRSLLDAGAKLAFGSDWFVAPLNPLPGIYAAVTRRTNDGRNPGGRVPEQKIAVDEAVRAYTSGSAYAAFEENTKGTITPGRLADMVVLSDDIFAVQPERIEKTEVLFTIVGGKIVFARNASGSAEPK